MSDWLKLEGYSTIKVADIRQGDTVLHHKGRNVEEIEVTDTTQLPKGGKLYLLNRPLGGAASAPQSEGTIGWATFDEGDTQQGMIDDQGRFTYLKNGRWHFGRQVVEFEAAVRSE